MELFMILQIHNSRLDFWRSSVHNIMFIETVHLQKRVAPLVFAVSWLVLLASLELRSVITTIHKYRDRWPLVSDHGATLLYTPQKE